MLNLSELKALENENLNVVQIAGAVLWPFPKQALAFMCRHYKSFNPLPAMPILGFLNSPGNKDMMSKIWTDGDTIIWLSSKHCGKTTNCSLWAISPFSTMFSKAVCCWCIKMSIYRVRVKNRVGIEQFFLFHQSGEFSAILITFKIALGKLFWVWKGLKFVIWERVGERKLQVYSTFSPTMSSKALLVAIKRQLSV